MRSSSNAGRCICYLIYFFVGRGRPLLQSPRQMKARTSTQDHLNMHVKICQPLRNTTAHASRGSDVTQDGSAESCSFRDRPPTRTVAFASFGVSPCARGGGCPLFYEFQKHQHEKKQQSIVHARDSPSPFETQRRPLAEGVKSPRMDQLNCAALRSSSSARRCI